MSKRGFCIGALTDVGNVKKVNQDGILVKVGGGTQGEFGLFVVADGMGGLAAGERASNIIVEGLDYWWKNNLSLILCKNENVELSVIDQELNSVIKEINKRIIDFGFSINEKVGSTLSVLFIYGNTYIIKHIGDSRIYLLNDSVRKLTEDHSWVAQQVQEGKISPEEAKSHPKRNVLTRCAGVIADIKIFELSGEIRPSDDFLLCSDGFYNFLDEEEIFNSISGCKKQDKDIQESLIELLEKVKSRGAHDNVSAIVICQYFDSYVNNVFGIKKLMKKITNAFGRW